RRLAAFASGLQDYDAIYDTDISKDPITNPESRTHLHDYIRAVVRYSSFTEMNFQFEMLAELTDIVQYLEGQRPAEKAMKIFALLKIHTKQVLNAIKSIQLLQDPLKPKVPNTLHAYIDE